MCFDDDLLMFYSVNIESIVLLQQTFHKLSAASGLQENLEKIPFYIIGVSLIVKAEIL